MNKFKYGEIINKKFQWRVCEGNGQEINEFYLRLILRDCFEEDKKGTFYDTEYVFIAWGTEARMRLEDNNGMAPFIHYFSPKKYAEAVDEFIEICLEHFGSDWLERGG